MLSRNVIRLAVIIYLLGLILFYMSWSAFVGTKSNIEPKTDLSFFTGVRGPGLLPETSEPCTFHLKSMINLPQWYRNGKWGLVQDPQAKFDKTLKRGFIYEKEEETAWNNFFYKATGGLMLEIGAIDGIRMSVSYMFEKGLNWRTILIEANPRMASKLSKNRPNALNFNLAICDSVRTVHYIYHKTKDIVNGILEFMTLGFLKTHFPELLFSNGSTDWEKIRTDARVTEISCVPLMSVLSPLGITHINFFLLDVENAELSVLKAIDFDKIKFDVISIETNGRVDDLATTEKYIDTILELLTSKGYVVWNRMLESNTWVMHRDFVPYTKNTTLLN